MATKISKTAPGTKLRKPKTSAKSTNQLNVKLDNVLIQDVRGALRNAILGTKYWDALTRPATTAIKLALEEYIAIQADVKNSKDLEKIKNELKLQQEAIDELKKTMQAITTGGESPFSQTPTPEEGS